MTTEDNKIAVLIDAENISYNDIDDIFTEIKRNGIILINRIYGGLQNLNNWKDACTKYSIQIRTQFQIVSGKNTSDSSLIIDAMDILYTKEINTFFIISSDSDYTGLIMRIKEEGKTVIGIGEKKTPEALINACNKFTYIENLRTKKIEKNKKGKQEVSPKKDSITPYETIEKEIFHILEESEGKMHISRIKELLTNLYPDFDPRNYHNKPKKFSDFVEQIKGIKVSVNADKTTKLAEFDCESFLKENKGLTCPLESKVKSEIIPDDLDEPTKADLLEFMIDTISKQKDKRMNVGNLIIAIKREFPKFTMKKFGVSRSYKLIELFSDKLTFEDKKTKHNVILIEN